MAAIIAILLVAAIVAWDLYLNSWQYGRETHGPIVMLASLYTFASQGRSAFAGTASRLEIRLAFALLPISFLLLFLGKSQDIIQLQVLSLPLLVLSACLAFGGIHAVRHFALILILLLLAVPLPGSIQDALLLPAKLRLSQVATDGAALLGIPVALSGAMIYVGYNQLQIADVCSGLDTFLSLLSVGFLLLFFDRPSNSRVAIAFLASMLVIAFSVNCLRILALIVTVHVFGMGAEQVAHDYAAYAELVIALALFVGAKILFEFLLGTKPDVSGR